MSARTYGQVAFRAPASARARGEWVMVMRPHVAIMAKRVLVKARPNEAGQLVVSDNLETVKLLDWFMQLYPLAMGAETRNYFDSQLGSAVQRDDQVAEVLAGGGSFFGLREPARSGMPFYEKGSNVSFQEVAAQLAMTTGRLLIGDDLGFGKAQPLDAKVLTPNGFRMMGDLAVGDLVIARDGTPTAVTGVFPQGELDTYEVEFSDGSTVECNDEHLWHVRRMQRTTSKVDGKKLPWYWQTCTLRTLVQRGLTNTAGQAKWHVPMVSAPDLDCGHVRPLDAYLLGALLGDGGFTGKSLAFTSADEELLMEVEGALPPEVVLKKLESRPYDYGIRFTGRMDTSRGRVHPVIRALDDLGLWGHSSLDKFVPDAYKLAPVADRLAMLQGLLDTDGHAVPAGRSATAQFYSSSERLARDVRWLAESLGGTGRLSSKWFEGRDRYTVTVKLPQPFNPFRLSRKARIWGDGHEHLKPTRAIKAVRLVGRKPMQCIAVEHPDHLYVTDRFVVTHNTQSSILALNTALSLPALFVCQAHLPEQIQDEIRATLPWLNTHIVKQQKAYSTAAIDGREPDVLIISYAKLEHWAWDLAGKIRTVVFDEVQEMRHHDTNRYSAGYHVASTADRVIGLSNTPVYNYADEAFSVVDLIHPGFLGSRDEFKREWCVGQDGKLVLEQPGAFGSYLREAGVMIARSYRDIGVYDDDPTWWAGETPPPGWAPAGEWKPLPMPKILPNPVTVDYDTDVIDRAKSDAAEMARLVLATATSTEAKKAKFQAAGMLDHKIRQATGIAKAPAVAAYIRMLLAEKERVVVFAWHRAVYELWAELLADFNPVFYTGEETTKQKLASKNAFINGNSRVLLISLRSGTGLNGLQNVCEDVVFGELDWSPAVQRQCVGRVARGLRRTNTVTAHYCISDGGTDPLMAEILQIKRNIAEPMMSSDGEVVQISPPDPDRIKRLAESILAGRPDDLAARIAS